MPYPHSMNTFTSGASDVLHRVVYPPFASLWSGLRNLTGRRRRAAKRATRHADHHEKSLEKQRRKTLWNRSHDR